MSDRPRRIARLREILRRGSVRSQDQLASLLRREGVEVTQATLSRDLRELGVMKGPGGYVLPEVVVAGAAHAGGNGHAAGTGSNGSAAQAPPAPLAAALRSHLLKAECGGTLAVLRTGPGQASPVALEIDNAGLRGVLGTVAGDDTVLVAARTPRAAAQVVAQFRDLAGLK